MEDGSTERTSITDMDMETAGPGIMGAENAESTMGTAANAGTSGTRIP